MSRVRAKAGREPRKRPGPAAADPDGSGERAQWLLRRAAQLMADKGYHDMSMRDLARAAKCSLAVLYHYFESKEDLLYQIQWGIFSTLLEEQERAASRPLPLEEKLALLVHNHLEYFIRNEAELKVCTFELSSLSGDKYRRIAELRRRYYQLLLKVVQGLLGEGVAASEVRHHTMFLFGALNWVFMWFEAEHDEPVDRLGDELVELVLHGLLHRPAKAKRAAGRR